MSARASNVWTPEYVLAKLPRVPADQLLEAITRVVMTGAGRESLETWELDQHAAAEDESMGAVLAAPPHPHYPHRRLWLADRRQVAVRVALLRAASRRDLHLCPHIHFPADRPMVVLLGYRKAQCFPCNRLEPRVELEQDGRCDVCDDSTEVFTPHQFTFGHVTFAADLCPACHRFAANEPPPPPPRKAKRNARRVRGSA